MGIPLQAANRRDARLWGLALGLSLMTNALVLGLVGLYLVESEEFRLTPSTAARVPTDTVITLIVEMPPRVAPAEPEVAPELEKRAARTTEAQRSERPANPRFIGERDTIATSDRAADATAPLLPSQAGLEPRNSQDFETTQSDYEEGQSDSDPAASAAVPASPVGPPSPSTDSTSVATAAPGEITDNPGTAETVKAAPLREALVEGPNPVEVPVPLETEAMVESSPPERPPQGETSTPPEPATADAPKPPARHAIDDPAFRSFQQKRAISGSISRTGTSALDVADTPLGRYQMAISRAVEREWQRNCVRHRDFITPGFLTVRFFVDASGAVKSVNFVDEMETGETQKGGQIQKGFTHTSIRDAKLPAMPAALAKEFAGEPLEIIFNFYF